MEKTQTGRQKDEGSEDVGAEAGDPEEGRSRWVGRKGGK
jgi:hypothetical protein